MHYLKSEYKMILAFFCYGGIFAVIFLLGQLPMSYFFLGMKILAFILILYLLCQRLVYQKERRLREHIAQLSSENQSLHTRLIAEQRDLAAYFLLWIHQIKTPITVAKLLLRKQSDPHTAALKNQLFYIEEYANMTMNYLKLKDRERDMDISEVPLDPLIKALLKKYAPLFIDKHLSLQYTPIPDAVISDAKWLSILIEQLLSNALKYTESGEIAITYHADEQTLFVTDTGIGIHPRDLKKIFDRGYSGFNGRINEKSSGLGLYLVKQIADLINVEVQVRSQIHIGSTFSIHFPDPTYKIVS